MKNLLRSESYENHKLDYIKTKRMALTVYILLATLIVIPNYLVQVITIDSLKHVYLQVVALIDVTIIIRGVAKLSLDAFMYYLFYTSF